MFADIDEMITCPWCNTEQAWEEALMGLLGNRTHFRCRGCGGDWSDADEEEAA